MTFGVVGIRCPDHAGVSGPVAAPRRTARRARTSLSSRGPFVTQALIGINVGIYLLQLLMGAGMNANSGWIYEQPSMETGMVGAAGTEHLTIDGRAAGSAIITASYDQPWDGGDEGAWSLELNVTVD